MTLAHITRHDQVESLEWIGGTVHHVLLDGAATDGRLTVLRSEMAGGAASPVHVHARDDETVVVLSGQATFWAGRERWELSSGDTAFLPRGVPHTYTITSDVCELVTICTPSGIEDFFRSVGRDLSQPRPANWAVDMAALAAAGAATGQTVLGPPLRPDQQLPDDLLHG